MGLLNLCSCAWRNTLWRYEGLPLCLILHYPSSLAKKGDLNTDTRRFFGCLFCCVLFSSRFCSIAHKCSCRVWFQICLCLRLPNLHTTWFDCTFHCSLILLLLTTITTSSSSSQANPVWIKGDRLFLCDWAVFHWYTWYNAMCKSRSNCISSFP